MSETKSKWMDKLNALRPYRKVPDEIVAGIAWYKIVDKNDVPLVNFAIAEDKADFICQAVNSQPDLYDACKIMLQEIEDNNYARYGIDPGMDDESDGAKLGRAALAKADRK